MTNCNPIELTFCFSSLNHWIESTKKICLVCLLMLIELTLVNDKTNGHVLKMRHKFWSSRAFRWRNFIEEVTLTASIHKSSIRSYICNFCVNWDEKYQTVHFEIADWINLDYRSRNNWNSQDRLKCLCSARRRILQNFWFFFQTLRLYKNHRPFY